MAIHVIQFSRAGTVPGAAAHVSSGQTQIAHYDSTVTGKDVAIGSALLLDETTEGIGFYEDADTGFRWGIVGTSGAALPANSPKWEAGQGGMQLWSITRGTSNYFKSAALA